MPDEFYNPYHFVPATGQVTDAEGQSKPIATEAFEALRDGLSQSRHPARHDRWVAGTHSGRLICRLSLERPTVIGGEQQPHPDDPEHQPKTVTPYRRLVTDAQGQTQEWPAIPGSSLRGLLATIAETLSQSALRVLADTQYSVRVKPGADGERALSALGYLVPVAEGAGRRFDLVPVALPTVPREKDAFGLTPTWQAAFRDFKWYQGLTAYVNGYNHQQERTGITAGTFLARTDARTGSLEPGKEQWWYARVPQHPKLGKTLRDALPGQILDAADNPLLHIKSNSFLLGARLPETAPEPIDQSTYDSLPPGERDFYVRGILRVLGIEGRDTQMPPTKKHELFIPMPEDKPKPHIPVPDRVVETFERIANDRNRLSKGEHPFALQVQGRPPETRTEVRPHELYFFDLAGGGNAGPIEVSELSISAVWRRTVGDRQTHRADSAHDFFEQVNRHLTPLRGDPDNPDAPPHRPLTPAELLFGVVAEGKRGKEVTAVSLASRLRVHDAISIRKPTEAPAEITLKTLSSPKPPSPALYFTPHPHRGDNPNQAIGKGRLNKTDHRPQGRKFYLHHPNTPFEGKPPAQWPCVTHERDHNHMRLKCRPLLPDIDNPFWFHIDFDNLSPAELTLLLAALRPADAFRHKLGLGKSLGLGSVRIDPVGLFLTDRGARYAEAGLAEPQYHQAEGPAVAEQHPPWQARWPREANALRDHAATLLDWSNWSGADGALIDRRALAVLCKLGDPAQVTPDLTITTPLTREQLNSRDAAARETETYAWFVANDDIGGPHRGLPPVDPEQSLPTLTAHPKKTKN